MSQPISPDKDLSPEKKVVNLFHKRDDCDVAGESHHHTIGIGLYQAASGKHDHQTSGVPLFTADDVLSGSLSGATATVLGQVVVLLARLGATNSTTP
jgi:hypothetical protein